jgi:DNA sulfur modification protein DndD
VIIEELVLHNFGLYAGYQHVSLGPPKRDKPITLIGGLNGGGKTSLLDAIQLSLYGHRARCSNRGNLSYEEYLRRSINRHAAMEEGAAVGIEFSHRAGGESKAYKVSRAWRFQNNKLHESLTVSVNGVHDSLLSETWNEAAEEIFPSSLTSLFFFDGEKIEEFADLENSRRSLRQAIGSLLGLDIIGRLNADLITFDSRQKVSLGTAADRKRIEGLRQECDRIEAARLSYVDMKAQKQTHEIDPLELRLKQLQEKYLCEGGQLINSRQLLEEDRETLLRELKIIENRLVEIAGGMAPLGLVRPLLEVIKRQSQAEQIARENVFLGRILAKRDEELVAVLKEANLGSEALKVVKDFIESDQEKRDLGTHVEVYLRLGDNTSATVADLCSHRANGKLRNEIENRVKDHTRTAEKIISLDRKLASIPDPESLRGLVQEIDEVKAKLEHARIDLSALDLEIGRLTREHQLVEAKWKREVEAVFGSELAHEDVYRALSHSKKVRDAILRFQGALVEKQVRQIESLVLESYKGLLRKTTLISTLSIDPSDFSIELRNAENQIVEAERLSAGERQLLAVAFLWGLARFSGRPFPTVIDTPLGRLDAKHRLNLVERYFPNASHQVILLSTDKEIDGTLLHRMQSSIGRAYTLNYDDKSGVTTISDGYFPFLANEMAATLAAS